MSDGARKGSAVSAAEVAARVAVLFPDGCDRLFAGDCLNVARALPCDAIDLIYIDPPFGAGRERRSAAHAYPDEARGGVGGYAVWLIERIEVLRERLAPNGVIYVHLDWRSVHYVKVAMDRLFGGENFLNEIVWKYDLGAAPKTSFPRKHDTLLRYRRGGRPYFSADHPSMRQPYKGVYPRDEQGRPCQLGSDGRRRPKDPRGKVVSDVWDDIQAINLAARERVGYPTQKPERLLERVIVSSCPPGGVVADLFCGSGVTALVARRLGRRWVAGDRSRSAVALTARRLRSEQRAAGLLGAEWPPFRIEKA